MVIRTVTHFCFWMGTSSDIITFFHSQQHLRLWSPICDQSWKSLKPPKMPFSYWMTFGVSWWFLQFTQKRCMWGSVHPWYFETLEHRRILQRFGNHRKVLAGGSNYLLADYLKSGYFKCFTGMRTLKLGCIHLTPFSSSLCPNLVCSLKFDVHLTPCQCKVPHARLGGFQRTVSFSHWSPLSGVPCTPVLSLNWQVMFSEDLSSRLGMT